MVLQNKTYYDQIIKLTLDNGKQIHVNSDIIRVAPQSDSGSGHNPAVFSKSGKNPPDAIAGC